MADKQGFLTDAELADIDGRIEGANRLRATFGIGRAGDSELERLVNEVRYWRKRAARSAPKRKRTRPEGHPKEGK